MQDPERRLRQGSPPGSTVALRRKLKADAAAGQLQDAGDYAKWLVEQDPELGLMAARRVVYRELRAIPDSANFSET
jgi:hypothetical protein